MKKWSRLLKKLTTFMALALLAGTFLLLYGANASLAQNNAASELATDTVLPARATGIEHLSADTLPVSETGLYIVQLTDPAVPNYEGGIVGLEATSPRVTGESRLDAQSSAVQAYIAYLHQKQDTFVAEMSSVLDRSVEVVFRYDGALNGLAIEISHEEALQLQWLPEVRAVFADTIQELETDIGPWFLGAPSVWFGYTGSGVATRGEGVIVGIIDTGVNFQHPSFAATDGDGYTHTNPYGAGVYNGWCATNPGFCNEKLIGAYALNAISGTPADNHGHGSHTGSTAAGNLHDAVFDVGNETYTRTVAGVAPRANVVHYKVCDPGCPQTASVAAVNHAIVDDQVDVLNYSISGVDNPWNDSVDLAFLEAFNAGIYIAASAGNGGPGPSTAAKSGPWNASTAASTINRIIAHTVDVTSPTTPAELQDMAAVPGENVSIVADITEEIRYNAGNPQGCNPGHPAGFFDDSIALVIRGACTFAEKVNNAAAAGADAVIVFNHVGGPPISMGSTPATPPSVMIDNGNGADLRDYIIANPGAEVTINTATALIFNDNWENVVAGFSSRGPSQFEMLLPTFIAPGVNTLAAGEAGPTDYYFSQGTSMSSPHAAGAGALLMALNPTWSPAQVRSALAMTANPNGLVKEDGVTPADWFDIGSGLLDLTAAGNIGLVMDETYANFVAANPDSGGDPKTLNLPAFLNYNCTDECSWTRTVTSVAQDPVTYTAAIDAPVGMTITVDPATFAIDPGATQVLTVTVDVAGMATGAFAFADIRLEVPGSPGDFVEVGEAYGPSGTWTERTHDISAYAGQEVCLAFRFEGSDTHAYYIDDILVTSDSGTHLDESFTDTTFPPAGWSYYELGTNPGREWARTTASFNTAPAAAWHNWNGAADHDDNWLVTPQFTLGDNPELTYYDRMTFISFYKYSGVWISTGSCNPTPVFDVAPVHMPVAVIPALAVPVITVDPDEMSAAQEPNEVTAQTLTIGNAGGVDLDWEIAEAPIAMRLGLTVEDGNALASSPMSFILDDGVGENAVGLTGGAQFLWFNRFTPNSYNFPITIDSVDVMYGYPGSTGGINVGELVDIYLYEDEDGDPTNGATHRASLHNQEVQAVDGVTWSTYTFATPVTFNGPGDILIAVVNRTAGVTASTFPAVIDQTPPSQQRSWIGFGAVPADPPVFTDFPTFALVDNFLAGNWMVRGFGTGTFPCDNSANVSWLDVDPDMGTTGPGSTTDVTVTFDSTGLAAGEYNALLCVDSNDPTTPLVEVPVTLTVEVEYSVELAPATAAQSGLPDETVTYILSITNTGNITDVFSFAASASGWTVELPMPVTLGMGESVNVGVTVEIPADAAGGAMDAVTVTATSAGDGDVSAAAELTTTADNVYGVQLSPATAAQSGIPGDTVTYTLSVTNTGNTTDSFGFAASGNAWDVALPMTITLNMGQSVNVQVTVEIPEGTAAGAVDVVTVVVTSANDPSATAVYDLTTLTTTADAVYGIAISPTMLAQSGAPGVVVTYTLSITNTGNITDVFSFAASASGWTVELPTPVTLGMGESVNADVTVGIPADAAGGAMDVVTITATSAGDGNISTSASLTTSVNNVYGVQLSPATAAHSGMPGEMVAYILTITNRGNVSDSFIFTASGNGWEVTLPMTVTLDIGGSTDVTVTVTIPAAAEDADSDVVTITATSAGDSEQSASSELTTTAEVEEPEGTMLYLPIILQP